MHKAGGKNLMKMLKKLIAVTLVAACAVCTIAPSNVSAATKTKAQIKKICEKKFKTVSDSYNGKIDQGMAATYDINQDGIPELIISDFSSAASVDHYSIIYAYNKKTGKLSKTVLDGWFGGAGKGYVYAGYTYGSTIYKMKSDGKFKDVAYESVGGFSADEYYEINGKKASYKQYEAFLKKTIKSYDVKTTKLKEY